MDTVIVLADGKRTCFTATLRGASEDIIPGDRVQRRILGWLGHDGKTGCGAKFTTVRVVCQNTLNLALSGAGAYRSVTHKTGANDDFVGLINSIDTAREEFKEECQIMESWTQHQLYGPDFRDFIAQVYDVDIEELEDGRFKKYAKLQRAFRGGLGQREFAPGTLWSAVNAVTEVETSTLTGGARTTARQFTRANFGAGLTLSRKACDAARSLTGVY